MAIVIVLPTQLPEAAKTSAGSLAGLAGWTSLAADGRGAGPARGEPEDVFVDQVEVPGVVEGAGGKAEREVQDHHLSGRQGARQAMARLPFQEAGAPRLPAAQGNRDPARAAALGQPGGVAAIDQADLQAGDARGAIEGALQDLDLGLGAGAGGG